MLKLPVLLASIVVLIMALVKLDPCMGAMGVFLLLMGIFFPRDF